MAERPKEKTPNALVDKLENAAKRLEKKKAKNSLYRKKVPYKTPSKEENAVFSQRSFKNIPTGTRVLEESERASVRYEPIVFSQKEREIWSTTMREGLVKAGIPTYMPPEEITPPEEIKSALEAAFSEFTNKLQQGASFSDAVSPLIALQEDAGITIDTERVASISSDIANLEKITKTMDEGELRKLIAHSQNPDAFDISTLDNEKAKDMLNILGRIQTSAEGLVQVPKIKKPNALWAINPIGETATTWLEASMYSSMMVTLTKTVFGVGVAAFSPAHLGIFAGTFVAVGVPNMMTKNWMLKTLYEGPESLWTNDEGKKGVLIATRKNALPAAGLAMLGLTTYIGVGFFQSVSAQTQEAKKHAGLFGAPIDVFFKKLKEKQEMLPQYAEIAAAIGNYVVEMERGKEVTVNGANSYINWTAQEKNQLRTSLETRLKKAGLTPSEIGQLSVAVTGKAGLGPQTWLLLAVLLDEDASIHDSKKQRGKAAAIREQAHMQKGEKFGNTLTRLLEEVLANKDIKALSSLGTEAQATNEAINIAATDAFKVLVGLFITGTPPASTVDLERVVKAIQDLRPSVLTTTEEGLKEPRDFIEALKKVNITLPQLKGMNMDDVFVPLEELAKILVNIKQEREAKQSAISDQNLTEGERAILTLESLFLPSEKKRGLASDYLGELLAETFGDGADKEQVQEWRDVAYKYQYLTFATTALSIQLLFKILFAVPAIMRGRKMSKDAPEFLKKTMEEDFSNMTAQLVKSFNDELQKVLPEFTPMNSVDMETALLKVAEELTPQLKEKRAPGAEVKDAVTGVFDLAPQTKAEFEARSLQGLLEKLQNDPKGQQKTIEKLMNIVAPGVLDATKTYVRATRAAKAGVVLSKEKKEQWTTFLKDGIDNKFFNASRGHLAFRIGVLDAQIKTLEGRRNEFLQQTKFESRNLLEENVRYTMNPGEENALRNIAALNDLIEQKQEAIKEYKGKDSVMARKQLFMSTQQSMSKNPKKFKVYMPPTYKTNTLSPSTTAGVYRDMNNTVSERLNLEPIDKEINNPEAKLALIGKRANRKVALFERRYKDEKYTVGLSYAVDKNGAKTAFILEVQDDNGKILLKDALTDVVMQSGYAAQKAATEIERWLVEMLEIKAPEVIRALSV